MLTLIIWVIFIGFTISGYYHFKWTVIFYLAIKVVLIKPIILFHINDFPLFTLDRGMELVLLFYLFLPQNKGGKQWFKFKNNMFFLPWVILIVVQALLFITHASSFLNASKGMLLFVFEYFLFYTLIVNTIQQKKEIKQLLQSLGFVFLLIGTYGLVTKWIGHNPFIKFFAQQAMDLGNENLVFTYGNNVRFGISGRVQSVVFHAIAYAGILALFIPVFVIQFLKSDEKRAQLFWYALIGILTVNLILANSRAAILSCGLISLALFYSVVKDKTQLKNAIWLLVPVVMVFLYIVINPNSGQYFNDAFYGIDKAGVVQGSTFSDRSVKFQYALEMMNGNFMFGKGFGHVAQLIRENNDAIGGAESFWLRQMIEGGLVGVLGYLGFFISICVLALRNFIHKKRFEALFIFFLTLGYFVFISLTGELNTFPFYILLLAVFSNMLTSFNTAHA